MNRDFILNIAEYDKANGTLVRKIARGNKKAGTVIGSLDAYGYLVAEFNRKKYKIHRLVWLIETGEFPESQLDHVNQKKDDNRFCNLRAVSHKANGKNRPLQRNNTSGTSGVFFNRKTEKWVAQIRVDGNRITLGGWNEKKLAVEAKKEAEIKYGFHENHGRDV